MLRKTFTLLTLSLLLAGTSLAQTATQTPDQAPAQTAAAAPFNKAKLDSLFTALDANHKLMGSLVLSQNGQVVYSRAIGLEQPGVPATAAAPTRYRIGSITKLITATMVMQLVEEGKLKMDAPIATWFPMLPNATKITVGQLLHHRSGLHNFTSGPDYRQYMTQPKTQAELLAIMAKPPVDFEPGAKFEYSNSNYVLLGYLVEKVTKKSYAQNLQKRITNKLNLKDTYYGGHIDGKKHEAASFKWSGTAWQPEPETDMSIPGGAGAIVSTPTDLARFMDGLFAGKLVTPTTLQQMQTMQDKYGIGLVIIPFGSKQGYGHFGSIDSYRSVLMHFPTEKLTLAYCGNGSNYDMNDMLLGVLSVAFRQPYHLPDFTKPVPPTVSLTAQDISQFTGTYASQQMPLKISVTASGATLMAQATGQDAFPLTARSKTQFAFDTAGIIMDFDATKHTFTLSQNGNISLFTRE